MKPQVFVGQLVCRTQEELVHAVVMAFLAPVVQCCPQVVDVHSVADYMPCTQVDSSFFWYPHSTRSNVATELTRSLPIRNLQTLSMLGWVRQAGAAAISEPAIYP